MMNWVKSKDHSFAELVFSTFFYFLTLGGTLLFPCLFKLLFPHLFALGLGMLFLLLSLLFLLFFNVVVDLHLFGNCPVFPTGSGPLPSGSRDGWGSKIDDGGGLDLREDSLLFVWVQKGVELILLAIFMAEGDCIEGLYNLVMLFFADDIVDVCFSEFSPSFFDFRPHAFGHCWSWKEIIICLNFDTFFTRQEWKRFAVTRWFRDKS